MAACIHGFQPGQCLICQTLASGQEQTRKASRPSRAERRAAAEGPARSAAGPVEVVDPPRPRGGSTSTHILVAVIMVVLAVIAFWVVAGVVFALLRLLEIVIVAAVAGVLGYRLGRIRGHQDR